MKGITTLSLAAMLAAFGTPAMATTVYSGYDNNASGGLMLASPNADAAHADFIAQLTNVMSQSFESYASGAKPSVLSFTGPSGSVAASLSGAGEVIGSYTRANPVASGGYAIDGSKFYSMGGSSFTIGFTDAVQALGFYAVDVESDLKASLLLASGQTETYSFDSLFNASNAGSGSVDYLGFTNAAGIKAITLSNFGNPDALAFDQFQVGNLISAVPESPTWGLMLLGMLGTGLALRGGRPTRRTAA